MSNLQPVINLGNKYVNGCLGAWASTTTRTVAAGQLRDDTDTFDIVVAAPLTVSSAVSGAGGLDTGTIANNTVYAVFVIFDPTGAVPPALLLSTSFTSPVMPSVRGVTYGAKRLVDFTKTDGSAQFLLDYNFSSNSSLVYKQFDAPIVVLNAGNAGTATTVDLSGSLPTSITGRAKLQADYTPHAAAETAQLKPFGATANTAVISGIVASVKQTNIFDVLPSSGAPKLSYLLSVTTSPAALTLSLLGAEFFI
jgi:hypothetical protein